MAGNHNVGGKIHIYQHIQLFYQVLSYENRRFHVLLRSVAVFSK
jgi:hypothetical protein